MAHYQVKINIQATRLPDPPPLEPAYDPGRDPLHEVAGVLRQSIKAFSAPVPGYGMGIYRESGLTLGKEVEIVAESFHELAELLGKFDSLAEEIEFTNSAKQ